MRKAYYLVEIDKALEGYRIPKEKMLSIGWTKLQMISAHITKKNYRILLEQADAHPVHELQDILDGKGVVENRHAMLFYLTPDQFELLAPAPRPPVRRSRRGRWRNLPDQPASSRAIRVPQWLAWATSSSGVHDVGRRVVKVM